jgi:hypothetical protein
LVQKSAGIGDPKQQLSKEEHNAGRKNPIVFIETLEKTQGHLGAAT